MRIGELARRLGTTTHAIRLYEREGVLPQPERSDNQYREYGEQDVRRLQTVLALRRLDVPLDDIRSLAGACFDHRCRSANRDLLAVVDRRSAEVQHQIDALSNLAAHFAELRRRLNTQDAHEGRLAMTEVVTNNPKQETAAIEVQKGVGCDCGCGGSGCNCGCSCCLPLGSHDAHRDALEVLSQPVQEACGCGCCG